MSTAKPVSLSVRAYKISHLCFEVDGIVEASTAELGASAAAFDFPAFYAILGSVPTVSGDPSRLLYDFLAIEAAVSPFALVALRKEARKADLNKAINTRQNAYYAKYANAPAIIAQMNTYYSPLLTNSKPTRLAVLSEIANEQFTELQLTYIADSRTGVVKTTGSTLSSQTQSSGSSTSTGRTDEDTIGFEAAPKTFPVPPTGGDWTSITVTGSYPVEQTLQAGSSGENSTSSGSASQYQTIVNTDYGYRIPYLEIQAQNQRAQISLIDQQFSQFMFGQNLPNLTQVFQNELQNIDGDVFRLQVAFLNTMLMSPIAGIVTGVYKHPGDPVRAGEPVVRVEDNSTILIVATVIYRGPIVIGSTVTIQTSLFDSATLPTTITGSVVSARGHRDDEKWELVVKCNNLDASLKPIFPLGYHFDYDDTTVSIT